MRMYVTRLVMNVRLHGLRERQVEREANRSQSQVSRTEDALITRTCQLPA